MLYSPGQADLSTIPSMCILWAVRISAWPERKDFPVFACSANPETPGLMRSRIPTLGNPHETCNARARLLDRVLASIMRNMESSFLSTTADDIVPNAMVAKGELVDGEVGFFFPLPHLSLLRYIEGLDTRRSIQAESKLSGIKQVMLVTQCGASSSSTKTVLRNKSGCVRLWDADNVHLGVGWMRKKSLSMGGEILEVDTDSENPQTVRVNMSNAVDVVVSPTTECTWM